MSKSQVKTPPALIRPSGQELAELERRVSTAAGGHNIHAVESLIGYIRVLHKSPFWKEAHQITWRTYVRNLNEALLGKTTKLLPEKNKQAEAIAAYGWNPDEAVSQFPKDLPQSLIHESYDRNPSHTIRQAGHRLKGWRRENAAENFSTEALFFIPLRGKLLETVLRKSSKVAITAFPKKIPRRMVGFFIEQESSLSLLQLHWKMSNLQVIPLACQHENFLIQLFQIDGSVDAIVLPRPTELKSLSDDAVKINDVTITSMIRRLFPLRHKLPATLQQALENNVARSI